MAVTKQKIEKLGRVLFPQYGIKDVTSLVATVVQRRNNDGHLKIWRPEGGWGWFESPGQTVVTPNMVTLAFPSDHRRDAPQARADVYRQLEDAVLSVMSEDEIEARMKAAGPGKGTGTAVSAPPKKSAAVLNREIREALADEPVTIVVAWTEDTQEIAPGQRPWRHDLGERPKLVQAKKAHAAMWRNRGGRADIDKAHAYSRKENPDTGKVYVYPVTEKDPLGRARRDILAGYGA